MKVKYLSGAYKIDRAHFDDAGIDFRTPNPFTLPAHGQAIIDLKVCVQIPVGYFGKMESKSGLMVNHGITCMGGVIDSGFRGPIKVRMINNTDKAYNFKKGDKVCQMVLIPTLLADIEPVDELDEATSGRNNDGWGSSGK